MNHNITPFYIFLKKYDARVRVGCHDIFSLTLTEVQQERLNMGNKWAKQVDWEQFSAAWDLYRTRQVGSLQKCAEMCGLSGPTFAKRAVALLQGENDPKWWTDYEDENGNKTSNTRKRRKNGRRTRKRKRPRN